MSREAHELSELTNFLSKDTLAELSERANWDCLYFPQWRSWGYRAVCRWNWGLPCGEAPRGPGSLISAESEALRGAGRRVVFGRLPLQTRGGPGPALVSEAPLWSPSEPGQSGTRIVHTQSSATQNVGEAHSCQLARTLALASPSPGWSPLDGPGGSVLT